MIPEEIKTKIKGIVAEKYSERNDSFIHNRYLDYCCGYSLASKVAPDQRVREECDFLKVLEENYKAMKGMVDEDKIRPAQEMVLETYEDLIAIYKSKYQK